PDKPAPTEPGTQPRSARTEDLTKDDDGLFQFDPTRLWSWSWREWWYDDDKETPKETSVLRDGQMVTVPAPRRGSPEARMAIAREAYRVQDYLKAERVFHRVGEYEKNPPKLVEEAKFYEAEALRLQGCLPEASDVYMDLMNKYPRNPYR